MLKKFLFEKETSRHWLLEKNPIKGPSLKRQLHWKKESEQSFLWIVYLRYTSMTTPTSQLKEAATAGQNFIAQPEMHRTTAVTQSNRLNPTPMLGGVQ